ncbi:MAG: S1 family peptidase [Anaerolineae bacterium]
MKRLSLTVAIMVVALVLMVTPVVAITGNYVKDFNHPYVGMIAFYDANGDFIWRCSGTLIDATTVLTAGHCADTSDGAVSARVWFQQGAGANYNPATGVDPDTGYPTSCAPGTLGTLCATSSHIYNYGYDGFATFPNTHDVGLVILDQPITGLGYGQLPAAGALDNLGTARGTKGTVFTSSGYGLSYSTQPQSGLPVVSFRERLMAESTLVTLKSANTDGYNLQTQGNGDDRGGTCSGDSGGPVFLGDETSNTVVAVTSFGLNGLCRGTDFSYRIDRQEVLDWIASH